MWRMHSYPNILVGLSQHKQGFLLRYMEDEQTAQIVGTPHSYVNTNHYFPDTFGVWSPRLLLLMGMELL